MQPVAIWSVFALVFGVKLHHTSTVYIPGNSQGTKYLPILIPFVSKLGFETTLSRAHHSH